MITAAVQPYNFSRRKTLTQQAMTQAARYGQTDVVSTLLELDALGMGIDFMVLQHVQRLYQLTDALERLLTGLDKTPVESMSVEAIRHLISPIQHQIKNLQSGLEGLN